jgi:hypothetical protein
MRAASRRSAARRPVLRFGVRLAPRGAGFVAVLPAFFGEAGGDVLDAVEALFDGYGFLELAVVL